MFKETLLDLKTVLELDTTLRGNISIWDYSIYDAAKPVVVVIRPGPMGAELDTFQDVWKYVFTVYVEVSAPYGASTVPREVSQQLLDYLDIIRVQLVSHSLLGKTALDYISARFTGFTRPVVMGRQGQDTEWFTSVATVLVEMLYEGDDLDG
jgi:hypothetical protein